MPHDHARRPGSAPQKRLLRCALQKSQKGLVSSFCFAFAYTANAVLS
jgi:hypothetical protein